MVVTVYPDDSPKEGVSAYVYVRRAHGEVAVPICGGDYVAADKTELLGASASPARMFCTFAFAVNLPALRADFGP